MPRQNRVTPSGELIAVADRGMFWGNRGVLVDGRSRLARYSRGRTWAICVLSYKGIRRVQWSPGRLTELYFLDEATGLAAGHRPCGECRYRDYQAFKRCWATAHPADPPPPQHLRPPDAPQTHPPGAPQTHPLGGPGTRLPGVQEIDARLHADRLAAPGIRRTYPAIASELPDGAMAELDGRPYLVLGGRLLAWTPGGYHDARSTEAVGQVTVITPRATVAVLAAGYQPILHPSAYP
jgi:hypothetical protein